MPKASYVSIKRQTKGKLPSLPFVLLKNKVLGRNYELSIVWATTKTSRNLNKHFRGYDRPTNILSFSLSPKSGELVLHWPTIRRDAPLEITNLDELKYQKPPTEKLAVYLEKLGFKSLVDRMNKLF